jgi:opacity protein-like surface antigen
MKRSIVLAAVLVVLVASFAASASQSSLFGTRFKVGAEIQFRVEDQTTWWWGCCSCTPSQVLGWRVTAAAGQVVYSVIHDAPIPAASWVGSWKQLDANGAAVAVGQYILYVDTTAGTLSRCFTLYDPCGCNTCWTPCWSCSCQEITTITNCACQTSLAFVDTCTSGCLPFFNLFGCTSCYGCGQP